MASYINGITTYIPEIQPSDVNLQIESQYAGFRKQKNDAARQQLSQLYGSLLNSPLSRQDNIEARDKFFETIEGQIKKISGMDLSLDQNAYQASQVFNQLLDDKYILKDMSWTKNYENQVLASQYLKNGCTDPEQCGGEWWSGGDRLLEYDREAFANATAEESLRFGNTQYIAKQNVTRKAMEFAKKYGVDVKTEQTNGMYIFTQKNGEAAIPLYSAMFNGMIAEDPRVMEYYNAMAKVERLDYIHTHENEFGSKEAAEQAYINEKMREMSEAKDDNGNIVATVSQDDVIAKEAENARTKSQRNKDIAAGLKVTASQTQNEQQGQSISQRADELDRESYYYDREYDRANSVITKINRDKNNGTISGEQIDAKLAWNYMNNDIGRAVLMASYMNSEMTIREDKYGLERYKASLTNQNKERSQQRTSSLYENGFVSTELGGTQIDEDINLFKEIVEKNAGDYSSLKESVKVNRDFVKAVSNFYKSSTFNNLTKEQKDAFKAVYDEITDVQKENVDLSKSIIQPLFTNLSKEGLDTIDKAIENLNELSSNDTQVQESIQTIGDKIYDIRNNYAAAYGAKQFAEVQANKILENIDAYRAQVGEPNKGLTQMEGLLRAYANGKIRGNTMKEKMTYLHSAGYSDFIDDNTMAFFNRDGKDTVTMNGGSILSIIESSGDENTFDWDQGDMRDYLSNTLEGAFGIERGGGWFDSWEDFGRNLHDTVFAINKNLISAFGSPVDMRQVREGAGLGNMRSNLRRDEDFYLNGKSIYEKDNNGNRIKKNGEYVLTSDAKSVLSKTKEVVIPYGLREDYINNDEAIIRGDKEFEKNVTYSGASYFHDLVRGNWGDEDATMNFNELTNEFARKYALLEYGNNSPYRFDSNGNLAVMAYNLNLSNNEDLLANQLVNETLLDFSRGNNMNNVKLSTSIAGNYGDAQNNDNEFRDFLASHRMTVNSFMNELANECERIAKTVKPKKDGTPGFHDDDNVGVCTYSPMALGNPNFSVLQFDSSIVNTVLKRHNVKADELPGGLYIYNKHGNSYNPTDTSNGYSKLDEYFAHTTQSVIVDSLNGKEYTGLRSQYADNIRVAKTKDGYLFSADVPDWLEYNKERPELSKIHTRTITSEDLLYGLDDGFNLAWMKWQEYLQGIYARFYNDIRLIG